ncbi:hypothetical protein E2C01_001460 [Portunus trituberculatus]|uniref:Uncharacterized protein n=1 Tax=Portunus trituberculatus TaxID=210409 RepID=A0A5B7CJG7_PORTR|nr:hypothetical protein [Portunus trituberculatus]
MVGDPQPELEERRGRGGGERQRGGGEGGGTVLELGGVRVEAAPSLSSMGVGGHGRMGGRGADTDAARRLRHARVKNTSRVASTPREAQYREDVPQMGRDEGSLSARGGKRWEGGKELRMIFP